jgi:hypothetical protein
VLAKPRENNGALVRDVFVTVFEGYEGAATDEQQRLSEYVELLLAHLGPDHDLEQNQDFLAPVLAALGSALGSMWWGSVADRETHQTLYRAARLLASRYPSRAAEIDELLAEDLHRAIDQSGGALAQVLGDLAELASGLSPDQLVPLAQALASLDPGATPDRPDGIDPNLVLTARALLAHFAFEQGANPHVQPFAIATATVREAIKVDSVAGDAAVAAWLSIEPSAAALGTVLAAGGHRSSQAIRAALASWGGSVTRKQRTKLLLRLLRPDRDTSPLISVLARGDFEPAVVIRAIEPLIKDSKTNKDQRMRLAEQAAAVAPTNPGGQRALAELIVWLLDRSRKRWPAVDIEVAVAALHGLGNRHGSKRRLETGFNKAAPFATRKLSPSQIDDFHQAGLTAPRAMLKKSWLDKFRS